MSSARGAEIPQSGRPRLHAPELSAWPGSRAGRALVLLVLGGALFFVYCPTALLGGDAMLLGLDHVFFHMRRLAFAREALFGAQPALPAWMPRELLGQPFWANVQSFPFIPTRLPLLLVDPALAFAVGANLGAQLAAFATYAFCRRAGLGPIAAATAGFTFAGSGYFAARVLAGHLPLLEAFASLPLLLWLADRAVEGAQRGDRGGGILALALAVACVALAAHPQIPFYSIGAAILYVLYRGRGRACVPVLAGMALGLGATGFVWWPALRLIGRSTRALALDPTATDVVFPYERLGAFVAPWKDGWPDSVERFPAVAFPGSNAVFWDTVCYVGLAPLAAAAFVAGLLLLRPERVSPPFRFVGALGALALATALPAVAPLLAQLPGTFLRSPARQVYLTEFALACWLGVSVDLLLRAAPAGRGTLRAGVAAAVVAGQAIDLAAHARPFIVLEPRLAQDPGAIARWREELGSARVAMDRGFWTPLNRAVDDVGFNDPIALARPYQALLALAGAPPATHVDHIDGSTLPVRALAYTGVARVVTSSPRRDLQRLAGGEGAIEYAVPGPAPRAAFVPYRHASFLDEPEIHARLRDPAFVLRDTILLPRSAEASPPPRDDGPAGSVRIEYERPSSDEIVVRIEAPESGFVRVLEAWDPGWSALVDEAPAPVWAAEDFVLALRVDPGPHVARLRYATPGVFAGLAVSAGSAIALAALVAGARSGARAGSPATPPEAAARPG